MGATMLSSCSGDFGFGASAGFSAGGLWFCAIRRPSPGIIRTVQISAISRDQSLLVARSIGDVLPPISFTAIMMRRPLVRMCFLGTSRNYALALDDRIISSHDSAQRQNSELEAAELVNPHRLLDR